MANAMVLYAHMTDSELVDKVRNGHKACYEVLIRRHGQPLYRIGRMHGLTHSDVEELIQNILLTTFQYLQYFEGRKSFRERMVKTMINQCLQRLEVITRPISFRRDPASEPASTPGDERSHGNSRFSDNKFISSKLESTIEQLPVPLRGVFVLCEIEGYSTADAAKLLHLKEFVAKQRLDKAKSMIRMSNRKWLHGTEVYTLDLSCCERIVNRVMGQIDGEEYAIEKAFLPRN